jgi:predicted heme/steroid binding protein
MTLAELQKCDGREGRPAYVAVNNIIYDVTSSPYWITGNHLDTHRAGADLTNELATAPHVRSVVERFPVVGKLEVQEQVAPKKLSWVSIAIMAGVLILLIVTFI